MRGSGKTIALGLAIGLGAMWTFVIPAAGAVDAGGSEDNGIVLARHEENPPSTGPQSEDPRAMTQAEWQALAQKVTVSLHWIGIQMGVEPQVRAVYVPALTQEYLQAFQLALGQGATTQQADILASQYIFARIRQLAGPGASSGQGGDGCVYSRGGSFCAGSDGFRSFSFR